MALNFYSESERVKGTEHHYELARAALCEAFVDSSTLTIEDVIGVIDENSRVEVYDTLSEQIAVYDGKDDLSECAGRPVRSIRAEGEGRIRIEVW